LRALPDGAVGIIAGGGDLPLEVARAAAAAGRAVFIIALRGFASRQVRLFPHIFADMLDPAGIIACLRAHDVRLVALGGTVNRPGPLAVASVFSAFRNRDEIARIMQGGDDSVLRGVVRMLEDEGMTVVGAHEVAPALLAGAGDLGAIAPDAKAMNDIALGAALLASIARFDVGQACVVAGGRVLGVEGPEGTDALLERVALLVKRIVKLDGDRPVLVKAPKTGQDQRIDMPAIGPRTIAKALAAGCAGLALAANGVIVIDRAETIVEADRAGLFVTGFST
jgi:UDP-2,3-diacylglucosamine hydrolase